MGGFMIFTIVIRNDPKYFFFCNSFELLLLITTFGGDITIFSAKTLKIVTHLSNAGVILLQNSGFQLWFGTVIGPKLSNFFYILQQHSTCVVLCHF